MSEAAEAAWLVHEHAVRNSPARFGPKHPFVVGYDLGAESISTSSNTPTRTELIDWIGASLPIWFPVHKGAAAGVSSSKIPVATVRLGALADIIIAAYNTPRTERKQTMADRWICPSCGDVMPPGFDEDDHLNCNWPEERE